MKSICNITDGPRGGIMLSEISQTGKDKYHMISLICRTEETKQMNKQRKKNDKQSQTLKYRLQTGDFHRRVGWGHG